MNESEAEQTSMKDATGFEIPIDLRGEWHKAHEVAYDQLTRIDAVRDRFQRGFDEQDPVVTAEIDEGQFKAEMAQIRSALERIKPYAVCATCSGRTRSTCTSCRERGYASKWFWDTCVPLEIKQIRTVAAMA